MVKIDSISEFTNYRDEAHLKYEIIRPVLLGQITSRNRANELQLHEVTLAEYIKRFRKSGYAELLDQRHGPSERKGQLNDAQKAHMILLRLAHSGFSLRELATIIAQEYKRTVDHKTVLSVLKQYEEFFTFSQSEEAIEHFLIRFRRYREYTPVVAGRYCIIELLEAGWKISTVSEVMQVSRPLIYYWQRRFKAEGILGLYNKPPIRVHFEETVSPAELAFIFENIENNLRVGNYRMKMMLNGRGNIKGHDTILKIIHLLRDVKKAEKKKRRKMPEEAPLEATSPHEIWFCDIRYLVRYQGDWVYSIIFIDGYSRMILAGETSLKQDLSHVVAVLQKALTQYGCPKRIVSDNGGVFKSHLLERAIDILGVDWHKIEKGRPWQNLMESFFSIEYRMLDSYVEASDDLKYIQRQHRRFMDEYNISGHWHHKSYTEDGRIYYKSPQSILGSAKGEVFTSQDLTKTFAFKHYQRIVSRKGQIRILGYILYVDEGLSDEAVDVYIYPECLQIEHNKRLVVEYQCDYDVQTKQLKAVKSDITFWRPSQSQQLSIFSSELYRVVVFTALRHCLIRVEQVKQLRFQFATKS